MLTKIEKILDPFGFTLGQLQDIVTLLKQLEKNTVPLIKFVEYIEEKKLEKAKVNSCKGEPKQNRIKWEQRALKCPKCSTTMNLYSVNTRPGDQTGDDSNSVWICPSIECMNTVYNKKTIKELTN